MVFTLGDLRELRVRRLSLLPRPARPAREATVTAVAEYTGLWGWEVWPGHHLAAGNGGRDACSCAAVTCPAPGAHPIDTVPPVPAGSTLDQVADAWSRTPDAPVLLPTGHTFDVLDVPGPAGRAALLRLERLGVPLGPVAAAPHGRLWFLTEPGTASRLPVLLERWGWGGGVPGSRGTTGAARLRGLGPGAYITAPPSSHGGRGTVRWLRPPGPDAADGAPAGRLLLGTLVYACHRAP